MNRIRMRYAIILRFGVFIGSAFGQTRLAFTTLPSAVTVDQPTTLKWTASNSDVNTLFYTFNYSFYIKCSSLTRVAACHSDP